MVDTALAVAAAQTLRLPGESTTTVLVKKLARQLLELDRDIKNTDKLITSSSVPTRRRRSSNRCRVWDRFWVRSSWLPPAAHSPGS